VKRLDKRIEEHSFSVEMGSKDFVKTLSFIEKENSNVLFEGFLGKLKNISMVEDVMLEIEGKNGIIKLDITSQEIEKCVIPKKENTRGETQ
jgi:hypothetical protein